MTGFDDSSSVHASFLTTTQDATLIMRICRSGQTAPNFLSSSSPVSSSSAGHSPLDSISTISFITSGHSALDSTSSQSTTPDRTVAAIDNDKVEDMITTTSDCKASSVHTLTAPFTIPHANTTGSSKSNTHDTLEIHGRSMMNGFNVATHAHPSFNVSVNGGHGGSDFEPEVEADSANLEAQQRHHLLQFLHYQRLALEKLAMQQKAGLVGPQTQTHNHPQNQIQTQIQIQTQTQTQGLTQNQNQNQNQNQSQGRTQGQGLGDAGYISMKKSDQAHEINARIGLEEFIFPNPSIVHAPPYEDAAVTLDLEALRKDFLVETPTSPTFTNPFGASTGLFESSIAALNADTACSPSSVGDGLSSSASSATALSSDSPSSSFALEADSPSALLEAMVSQVHRSHELQAAVLQQQQRDVLQSMPAAASASASSNFELGLPMSDFSGGRTVMNHSSLHRASAHPYARASHFGISTVADSDTHLEAQYAELFNPQPQHLLALNRSSIDLGALSAGQWHPTAMTTCGMDVVPVSFVQPFTEVPASFPMSFSGPFGLSSCFTSPSPASKKASAFQPKTRPTIIDCEIPSPADADPVRLAAAHIRRISATEQAIANTVQAVHSSGTKGTAGSRRAGHHRSESRRSESSTAGSTPSDDTSSMSSGESVRNPHGGGRGYVPGETPDDPRKKHKCDVCGRGFARLFNLKSHQMTHDPTRPKPFACPHPGCKRAFSRLHDLERHQQGIHAEGPLMSAKEQGISPAIARAQERIAKGVISCDSFSS